jgi:sugar/nucleoside kinase (ribokinase family)
VLLFAPAFHELRTLPRTEASVVAFLLQGALRALDGDTVIPARQPFEAIAALMHPGMLCFFSEEDTADAEEFAAGLASVGATVILTRGQAGATWFHRGVVESRHAFRAAQIDPTGAGDVFATAYTLRFAETHDYREAMNFALMAGALAVEGRGIDGIPTRRAIESRLATVAA